MNTVDSRERPMICNLRLTVICTACLVYLVGPGRARGDSVIADAVFAHDFENISGNTISALVGPDATKTSNITADTTDPVQTSSTQHVQTPVDSSFATIDANSRLTTSTQEMSFSIFYNDRGTSGSGVQFDLVRFLSSYDGEGGVPAEQTTFGLQSSSGRRFHAYIGTTEIASTDVIPFRDSMWHHAGFVFDTGVVTFYFDGVQLGNQITLASTVIPAQTFNWHLIEDALGVSTTYEYFHGGDYDEAALWYRVLSGNEMLDLFTNGLPVPEPASLMMCAIAIVALSLARNRRWWK